MMSSVGAVLPLLLVLLQGLSGALIAMLLGLFFYLFLGYSAIGYQPVPERGHFVQPLPAVPTAPTPPTDGLV